MSVYKPCDIRGPVRELSRDLYREWGRALGSRLPAGAAFPVGGDVRPSTPSFREAFIEGVRRAGARAVDLGTLPTPMVYFAMRHLRAPACAIVTASHSPPDINGLKWMVGQLPPSEEEVQELRAEVESGKRKEAGEEGRRERLDIAPRYRAWLRGRWGGRGFAGRAVLDPGNGCWAGRAGTFLEEIFPEGGFAAIHDRVDGLFRARDPDSSRPRHLRALAAAVHRQKADLGIAFDGDGDRVAFVDGDGQVLTAEESTWILVQSLGAEWKGRVFVHDVKFSDRIPELVERLGGRPQAQRSGHAFIRTRMIEQDGLFGAEISGHYFYGELVGGDDGLFTACRMLGYLEECGRSLALLRGSCPPIFTTADLRLSVAHPEQAGVLEQIKRRFQHRPQRFVDGVRVDFPDGWVLVRSSVTAPELTFRFEGRSARSLDRLVREFSTELGELGGRLREQREQEKAGRI